MKKRTYLLVLISLSLVSCGGSKASQRTKTTITPISYTSGIDEIPSSENPELYSKISINYSRLDGSLIKRTDKYFKQGEYYRIKSPTVNFMAPSKDEIVGLADGENHLYMVTYDYAPGHYLENVECGEELGPNMVLKDKGLSFSFALSNCASPNQALLVGDRFTIYNTGVEFRTSSVYFWSDRYSVFANGAAANGLVNLDTVFVTFSFNADESITCYKNGKLLYYWAANLNPETGPHQYHFIYEITNALFNDMKETGITIGNKNNNDVSTFQMTKFSIGNAVNDGEALEKYNIEYLA